MSRDWKFQVGDEIIGKKDYNFRQGIVIDILEDAYLVKWGNSLGQAKKEYIEKYFNLLTPLDKLL